ncbi:hypothetical protein GDO78_016248 [Eleutherodactylus coqui]|uniref:Flavin-containing monooxygenase n=1 Tax=Eleutherodactylus coqui TaxID=57060 RepID=A0A8J6C364_ELECQ|nr:hypothetical protein GDO78_016248 [Eleutherodactylus coqui]
MVKTVAVIGSGISGLGAIKACLEEGLEPTCFERSNDIGGLWRFTDEVEEGRASIYKSLVTNVSKEIMCLSDFPMPDDFPNFLPNHKYFEYIKLYAEHFKLLQYINFKPTTELHMGLQVPPSSLNCIKKFKGQIIHCQEYKRPIGFDGKRVLIIGMGNTGVDISTELCTRASQVYLSSRQGVWVVQRCGKGGLPYDLDAVCRYRNWISTIMPPAVSRWMLKKAMNAQFDHELYNIQPEG